MDYLLFPVGCMFRFPRNAESTAQYLSLVSIPSLLSLHETYAALPTNSSWALILLKKQSVAENVSTETTRVADIQIFDKSAKKRTRIGVMSMKMARRKDRSFTVKAMRNWESCMIPFS
jgi:hypothetical protein